MTVPRPDRVQNYWGEKDEEKSDENFSAIKIMGEGYTPAPNDSVYYFSHENGVVPNSWPRDLRYRLKPRFIDTKSAALIQRYGSKKYHIIE